MTPWLYRAGIRGARALGWPGLAGLVLLAGAGTQQWRLRAAAPDADAAPSIAIAQEAPPNAAPAADTLALLDAHATPQLQRDLATRAAGAGLAWSSAEYRLLPATDRLPPAYEVRCSLKGGYPAIRRFVAGTLDAAPSAALREFALARPGVDGAEVEAHVSFAFFLAPRPADPASTPAGGRP